MPAKKYLVKLEASEREQLLELTRKGVTGARKLKRAQILLKADEGWKDEAIIQALNTNRSTVERTRKRSWRVGWTGLNEDPRPGQRPRLDGRAEAHLIALACSDAPGDATIGRCACWRTNWSSWASWSGSRTKPFARP